MGKLKELKHSLRDISLMDIIRSKIFKSPCMFYSEYNEPFSDSISDFLDKNPYITQISQSQMTLTSDSGKSVTFWVGNYPYLYGNVTGKLTGDHSMPSWKVVLRLRRLQLTRRQQVIDEFIASSKI